MKKKTMRSVRVLFLTVSAALIFSGFTQASDTADEAAASELMLQRTEILQRAMFGSRGEADIYSELSAIETHPLLEEDMKSLAEFRGSDADKVINMKVLRCAMTSKKGAVRFYDITVRWYMLGCDGYYTEESSYRMRTSTSGTEMNLSSLQAV